MVDNTCFPLILLVIYLCSIFITHIYWSALLLLLYFLSICMFVWHSYHSCITVSCLFSRFSYFSRSVYLQMKKKELLMFSFHENTLHVVVVDKYMHAFLSHSPPYIFSYSRCTWPYSLVIIFYLLIIVTVAALIVFTSLTLTMVML